MQARYEDKRTDTAIASCLNDIKGYNMKQPQIYSVILVALFTLTVMLFCVACESPALKDERNPDNLNVYYNEELDIRFHYPNSWEIEDTESTNLVQSSNDGDSGRVIRITLRHQETGKSIYIRAETWDVSIGSSEYSPSFGAREFELNGSLGEQLESENEDLHCDPEVVSNNAFIYQVFFDYGESEDYLRKPSLSNVYLKGLVQNQTKEYPNVLFVVYLSNVGTLLKSDDITGKYTYQDIHGCNQELLGQIESNELYQVFKQIVSSVEY